jgi:hypothetical protein
MPTKAEIGRSLERFERIKDNVPIRYRQALLEVLKGRRSPRQAIKAKCAQCCGYEDVQNRVSDCTIQTCALWAYRPYQKGDS